MRRLALLAVLALAACGGSHKAGPEGVVRAWSDALNRGDDAAAAALFAPGARIIQGNTELVLATPAQARTWNGGLPCSGTIVALETKGDVVTATFLLADRPRHSCDAPGVKAETVLAVRGGKIVLWHQIASAGVPAPIA